MLKYKEYVMNENTNEGTFKDGDSVIYTAAPGKPYNKKHNGKKGVIDYDFNQGEYNIKFEDGITIVASTNELSSPEKEKEIKELEVGTPIKVLNANVIRYRDPISNSGGNIKQLANYTKDNIKGKVGKITQVLDKKTPGNFGKYLVDVEGNTYTLYGNEITPDVDFDMSNYVENQFSGSDVSPVLINKPTESLKPGQRIIVSGYKGRSQIEGRKGTIKRVSPGEYFINFDANDSKNQASISMMVDKKYIKPIEDDASVAYSVGDKVICVDNKESFFNKVGEITKVWADEFMVFFEEFNTQVALKPEQIKIKEYTKPKSTGFTTNPNVKTIPVGVPTDKSIEEDEDEDEDGVVVTKTKEKFKKADLLEFSYKDFFADEEKIVTSEEVTANRVKFQGLIDNPEVKEFKKVFYERSVKVTEIIEQYFTFLKAKVAGELPVFRTLEEIKNEDLLVTKTKVRASESREISKKYSFDQGIIAYWKFKDAVIFKTI